MKGRWVALVLTVTATVACGRQEGTGGADGVWVGTITTEGDVTTVVNESGSVWGGPATLVEEASIGVAAGAQEYMFGLIGTVHGTDDRIYVTDPFAATFRLYDRDGRFIRSIGRKGQGPGEYGAPSQVTTGPDGAVFLYDQGNHRVNLYSAGGSPIGDYPGRFTCCNSLRVADDGELWGPVRELLYDSPETFRETLRQQFGIRAIGPDGPVDPVWTLIEPDHAPIEVPIADDRTRTVPFSPAMTWSVAGPETMVVGTGDTYRYAVQHRDRIVRVVEKYWNPVPIDPEHAAWARDFLIAGVRQSRYRPVDWKWDGAEIPSSQPAFTSLVGTETGQVWAARPGRSIRVPGCVEDPIHDGAGEARQHPCWRTELFLDVFDAEGRFLGTVEAPEGIMPVQRYFSVRGDQVVAVVEDDAGIFMVKRYRLVLPGEAGAGVGDLRDALATRRQRTVAQSISAADVANESTGTRLAVAPVHQSFSGETRRRRRRRR